MLLKQVGDPLPPPAASDETQLDLGAFGDSAPSTEKESAADPVAARKERRFKVSDDCMGFSLECLTE